jgi:hypothetical protein
MRAQQRYPSNVALLLRDRDADPASTTSSPNGNHAGMAPDFACAACGAGMQAGQDWCLECGTAAPGRLGARPGWLAAFGVVAAVLLLVFGAGIAGYAALTSDAERTAAAPTAGNGNPIIAQAPTTGTPAVPGTNPETITPGATGPGTVPPAVTNTPASPTQPLPGQLPGSGVQTPVRPGAKLPVIPPTRPVTPPANQTVTPPAVTPNLPSTTGPSTSTPSTSGSNVKPAVVAAQVIDVKADAAKTYDPAQRAGAEIGPPANAVDGKPKTVWDVVVPADRNPIGVGLLVDLPTAYALRSLRIATNTPGFSVELYGAVDTKELPVDVLDKRWQHLTDVKSVQDGAPIVLTGKGDAPKYQRFLVWVTTPGEPTDPRAAIGELTLRGTP